jgi:cellobiose phosphorylase
MKNQIEAAVDFPSRITSRSGMSVEINANGSIRRMDHGDIMLNLFLGNEAEGGPVNVYLRRHGASMDAIPMLGPGSPASYAIHESGLVATGQWGCVAFCLRWVLAESVPAWFLHVELENTGTDAITCDLILTQDLALAHYGAIRLNEYYVSQYVDHSPLEHPERGVAVASRQNQSMGGRCPWTIIGSLGHGVAYATDALQFHGLSTRAGGRPTGLSDGLPGKRQQHEHSMVSIQDSPVLLEPGAKSRCGFFGWLEADKPGASGVADLAFMEAALALPEAVAPNELAVGRGTRPAASLFTTAPLLESLTLDDASIRAIFGEPSLHAEIENGRLLSFFTGAGNHVVLQAKELRVLRPHGHLLRTGDSLTPDESSLASTVWMSGVFHSMVTQGHVSINRFLSTCHGYLGMFRSHGQRVFVESDGGWKLLDRPSAFEMAIDHCRWIYQHRGGLIEVVASAPVGRHELRLSVSVLEGQAMRFLISHHVALNGDDGSGAFPALHEPDGAGVLVRAVSESDVGRRFPEGGFRITPAEGTVVESIGGDEELFADRASRKQPFLCFVTAPALDAGLIIEGCLVPQPADPPPDVRGPLDPAWQISAVPSTPLFAAAARLAAIFPCYVHNALVHYLSPRGLEQYSGGGWGTRDICQGPLELLLALGRFTVVRDLLARVFRQQNPDGDWPQWFMFFERERNIRPDDSHGDIVYWPVLALAQYLRATGDLLLLDEIAPFFHSDGEASAEMATVWQHVERALDVMKTRVIAGTGLAAYGHGDWNDSLQPVKKEMRERLCSSWTVTLAYQTFTVMAEAFRSAGQAAKAGEFEAMAATILDEFQRVLIVDGVVAGLMYFHEDGKTEPLIHPRDGVTGLSYSLLPMIHAILNDMFTPRQAEAHLEIIRKHLLGPDGAHLFDRPLAYHGGPQQYFQRAESASYFGREIGIMYTHAHLRYCEALARFGDAEGFFHALCQANPIAIREIVPSAALRQANCYYSSSDPAFADRYEAFDDYAKVQSGEVALEGGWRVYSSGAGICVRLIQQCFLGLRFETSWLVVDPVMPAALNGLKVTVPFEGRRLHVIYQILSKGRGPVSVTLNGSPLEFSREPNPYRPGAARILMADLAAILTDDDNHLTVWIE